MHKGVIILTQANSKEEALGNVENFLESYEGEVWDWYQIGGRWNNTLAPKDKLNLFNEQANLILVRNEQGWLSQQEIDDKQEQLQKIWEKCGLEGLNPYCDHYKLSSEGNTYDIVPLANCIDIVKEWCKDLEKEKEELWDKLLEAKEKANAGEYDSTGYYAELYKNAQYENFSFESNVFNAAEYIAEEVPEDIENYYAVMVDLHN